jgi:ABC-type uncharacterized transport system auxiliary subunit
MRRSGWLVAAPALLAGCLFRNTSAPPRYFAPASAAIEGVASDDPVAASATGVPIRLRSVQGTPFLREHIVWRVSTVEYGQYEERLWSELPARYVERALVAALRRTPGLRLTDEAHAAALRVDVLAFDEVLSPAHTASVALAASLRGEDGRLLLDRTLTAEAPIAGNDPATMATAMGRALDEATAAVGVAVAEAVRAR